MFFLCCAETGSAAPMAVSGDFKQISEVICRSSLVVLNQEEVAHGIFRILIKLIALSVTRV